MIRTLHAPGTRWITAWTWKRLGALFHRSWHTLADNDV